MCMFTIGMKNRMDEPLCPLGMYEEVHDKNLGVETEVIFLEYLTRL
jgi:hypothetical protein